MQSANIHIITTSYKLIGSDPAAKEIACLPFKGVVHFKKKKLLIIYSLPCHPRYPCHSFFSRKEMKVFDENIPGFFSI